MAASQVRPMTPASALGFALLAFAVACLAIVLVSGVSVAPVNDAWAGRSLYVYPDSPAAVALAGTESADEAAAFELIARTPTAIWLEPEEYGTDDVGEFVSGITDVALSKSEIAVFVIYGITDRDCGQQSRGGLPADQYPRWVGAIADALADTGSVVILEPDSLALASKCGNLDERIPQISRAIDAFAGSGATVYLDGGHSDWLPADTMAAILDRARIERVRGFATNVSNYNSTDDEVAYANRLSALTGGSHYVIDVSRNGNGSNGQWCNPDGRRLGATPEVETGETMLDAMLWIKPPGESDGSCGGGPPAGDWWTDAALELTAGR